MWKVGKTFIYFVATCGSILMLIGVLLTMKEANDFTMLLLSNQLALRNDSPALKTWMKTPFPVLFKVYIWNVTNPKEVKAGGKPRLTELGPYVYEQWRERVNVKEEANETLSYNDKSTLLFSEALSKNRRESDIVTIIHLPIVGMALRVDEIMPDYVKFLDKVWPELFPGIQDIFLRATVRDLLFDGIPIDCSSKDFVVTTACNGLEGDLPSTIRKVGEKAFRFSFFDYKRRVSSNVMRVYKGTDDIKKLGQIFSFNNAVSVNKWHNHYCDMVNGSDGSKVPAGLKKNDVVYFFQPDFCRSLYTKFERELVREKVTLFRYVNTPDLFASPENNPNNECFCAPKAQLSDLFGGDDEGGNGTDHGDTPKTCMKNGAMLLTPCLGAPIVITFPHFYMADSSFFDYVQLNPNKELHETFVDIEPLSGIPFMASKRVQFNIEVKTISDMEYMSNLTPGLFPILWVEETMQLPEEIFSQLSTLLILTKYLSVAGFAIIGVATVILIIAGVCYVKKKNAVSWLAGESSDEAQEGPYEAANGFGLNGVYSNRVKVPFNIAGNVHPGSVSTNGFVQDYPILTKPNAGRIYPNQSIYRENFM